MLSGRSFCRVFSVLAALCAAAWSVAARAESIDVASPSGRVVVTVDFDAESGAATYRVFYDGSEVVGKSKLGLVFHAAADMSALDLVGVASSQIDETTNEPRGRKSTYVNRCTETVFETCAKSDRFAKMNVVVRAYDDAFALRYEIPEASTLAAGGEFRVDSETTEFAFDRDYDAFACLLKGFNTDQQGIYAPKKLSDIKSDSFVAKPLLVKTKTCCVALAESDLLNWAGMQYASRVDAPTTITIRLTPRDDKRGCVIRTAPARSPWRVAIFGKTPVDVVNNADVIYNCATPCQIDASWVRPGNSTWDWWAPKGAREISDRKLREFIDFGAEMGWEYTLVDAGWYKRPNAKERDAWDWSKGLEPSKNLNVPECVKYGKEKGVDVLLWMDWPDIVHTDLEQTFKTVADWGVAGVKIDHMNSHSQETVAALTDAVRLAAKYKLLVNFHGMYVPTGLERTYPNQITREAIRGNEYFRGSSLPLNHAVTMLFTRMLLGPGDYTPGGFRNEHSETYKPLRELDEENASCRVVGTRAHELALCMLYDSPLRCLCDLPTVYRDQPGLEYLRDLPCAWDDTLVLDGEPEEFVVMARRSGDDWYVSGITNTQPRRLSVTLDFLEKGAEFEGTFYVDAPESDKDANVVAISTRTFRKGDRVDFELVREGGANLVLKRQ